jgi:uncharacterized protein (TIGR02147 family)
MRQLASEAGVALGYLSMLISGKRKPSLLPLLKLIPHLQLEKPEQVHLEKLVKFGAINSRESQIHAFDQMSRSRAYQKRNPQEAEFFHYVSRWYHIAIREMAALPGFKAEPKWIQARLKPKLPLLEIKDALDFLLEKGYLQKDSSGVVAAAKQVVDCKGSVYWTALSQSHRQMFQLASDSIESTHSSERRLDGYTLPLNVEQLAKANEILSRAVNEIAALEGASRNPPDSVYHLEIAFFPMTQRDRA